MGHESVLDRFREAVRGDGQQTVVFYVEIGDLWDDDYEFETALRLLPLQQQARIVSKRFRKDAQTALANQLLQRAISCLYLDTSAHELNFQKNQYGKPYLRGADFSFSMSNQQGYTSMVVSQLNQEVGIDLASCSDVDEFGDEYLSHFKDIFHKDEYQILEDINHPNDLKLLFTQYWALKESYTKFLGIGLNGDLASYNFQHVELLPCPQPTLQNEHFTIHQPTWSGSTTLSINSQQQQQDIYITRLSPDIVVSVIGSIPQQPMLVQVPLELITACFT